MANAEISNQEIIITLPEEKVYQGIKEKLEEYITGTKWLDTCFIKAVWRRDRIHLDRD